MQEKSPPGQTKVLGALYYWSACRHLDRRRTSELEGRRVENGRRRDEPLPRSHREARHQARSVNFIHPNLLNLMDDARGILADLARGSGVLMSAEASSGSWSTTLYPVA